MSPGADAYVEYDPAGSHPRWWGPLRQMWMANLWVRFGAEFSRQSDQRYMSPEHCLLYLHRRVATARDADARSRNLPGRMFNRLTGQFGGAAHVSSHVLNVAFNTIGETPPAALRPERHYLVSINEAERLLARLREVVVP